MSEISSFSQINPQKLKSLCINNSGKSTILKNEIMDFILKDIQKIPNYQSLKNEVEILLHICNLIENLISKNKQKIDKKKLVLDIMAQVFHFNSDSEKEGLEKQIQFLYDNKLITKVTKFKQVAKKVFAVANFILKEF
jgi:hypothetical protein